MGEEEIIQEAIAKAKEIIQEAGHLGILENKDDLMGEEVKVKKPKKNPSTPSWIWRASRRRAIRS